MTEVVVRGAGGLRQEIEVRGHQLWADEPTDAGGGDTGPNPYELLLGALGACTAMTVTLYAQRKQWPLEGVEVVLRHARMHAADCADCDTREGFLDRIDKELTLRGALDNAQRQRLAEIAERCPLQRTLQHEIVIAQTLAPAP